MSYKLKSKHDRGFMALALAGFVLSVSASSAGAGVVGCKAPGRTQEGGAIVGAILGGVIGNQVGGRNAGGETLAGVAIGAAAGSAIGCEIQKDRPGSREASRSGSYVHNGYRLLSDVRPARYDRIAGPFVTDRAATLRAGPNVDSRRVGRLARGERFQALASVRDSEWILVGRDGVGIGYVRSDLVQPTGGRYAYGR